MPEKARVREPLPRRAEIDLEQRQARGLGVWEPPALGPGVDLTNVVAICAWCPHLHVIRIDHQPGDHFSYSQVPDAREPRMLILQVSRWRRDVGWTRLNISHGICDACRQREYPTKDERARAATAGPDAA